jgi:hypothetical protein
MMNTDNLSENQSWNCPPDGIVVEISGSAEVLIGQRLPLPSRPVDAAGP